MLTINTHARYVTYVRDICRNFVQLQTEIKIHRTLQHPRVVRFEMFFEDRENVYILLELCANHVSGPLCRRESGSFGACDT